MPKLKKKIGLKATEIIFKKQSIVYKVEIENSIDINEICEGVICANNNIKDKDLILKTTYLDDDNLEVIFVPINVTVEFYHKIFLDSKSKLSQEYILEKNDIYKVGDIVAFIYV